MRLWAGQTKATDSKGREKSEWTGKKEKRLPKTERDGVGDVMSRD